MDFVVSSFRAFVIELLFAAGDGHGFRPSMSDVGTGTLGTSDTISAGWDTDRILDRYRELERRVSAGQANTAGKSAAENLGTFPSTGAMHAGTNARRPLFQSHGSVAGRCQHKGGVQWKRFILTDLHKRSE